MRDKLDSKKVKIVVAVVALLLIVVLGVVVLNQVKSGNNALDTDKTDAASNEPTHADILDKESETTDSGEQVLFIPKEDVYSFTMTDANGIILEFDKKGVEWLYIDDETLDINEDRIDKVLNYLTDVRFDKCFETEDSEQYGITQDSRMYTITDANGTDTTIIFGDSPEDSDGIYFAINYDFSTIYLNSGKLKNVGDYYIEELIAF